MKKEKNPHNLLKFGLALVMIFLGYALGQDFSLQGEQSQKVQIFAYILGEIGIILGIFFGAALIVENIRKKPLNKTDITENNNNQKQELLRQLEPSTRIDPQISARLKSNQKSPLIREK